MSALRWHDLKTDPGPFEALRAGIKSLEIRRNDRDFWIGDVLILRECFRDQGVAIYSGRLETRTVTHVLYGGKYGLEDGFVALSLRRPTAAEHDPAFTEWWEQEQQRQAVEATS